MTIEDLDRRRVVARAAVVTQPLVAPDLAAPAPPGAAIRSAPPGAAIRSAAPAPGTHVHAAPVQAGEPTAITGPATYRGVVRAPAPAPVRVGVADPPAWPQAPRQLVPPRAGVAPARPTPASPAHRAVAGPGFGRRALDLMLGGAALLVVALPVLALMLAVRLDSPGPALFRQIRIGQGGRPFTLFKLRSMRTDVGGPEVTAARDPRITRLGRLLRATSLDELPQLWNVVRGQMTLVGPRPETPMLAAGYPSVSRWVLAHRPGLTGPAQVRMRDAHVVGSAVRVDTDAYLKQVVPARTAIEAEFLANPTLLATLRVMLDTVRHLLGRPIPPR